MVISDGAVSSVRTSYLVQSDKKIEAKTCVSSPPRTALSTTTIKETPWIWSFKNHKEPEQRIYKKPNLVVKPLQLVSEVYRLVLWRFSIVEGNWMTASLNQNSILESLISGDLISWNRLELWSEITLCSIYSGFQSFFLTSFPSSLIFKFSPSFEDLTVLLR